MNSSTKVCVIGLGNILLKDEGVGVHALKMLQQTYSCLPEIAFVDGGTMGLDLIPYFEDKEKVLIIDAVNFGKEPGYIGVLQNDEIPSVFSTKISVHNIGLADITFALKAMDMQVAELCLIGIQPNTIEVGLDLTEEINAKLPQLIERVVSKLKEWNITCVLQSPQESSK